MLKKTLLFILVAGCFTVMTSFTPEGPKLQPKQEFDCEPINQIYADALEYFQNNRGEQFVKNSLLGPGYYYDYKIDLWGAEKVELSEVVELGCNLLEYTFVESPQLADGRAVYDEVLQRFESCKPDGYIRTESTTTNNIERAHFIDTRDKEAFLFYDWPEFVISLTNVSNVYTVKIAVYSKKFD